MSSDSTSGRVQLSEALRPLAETLACDGYAVTAELAHDVVLVRVTAGPNACEECLVPKGIMGEIVAQALGDAGLGIERDQLRLTYPGEPD
jgi:hypothetical protein